MSLIEHHFTYIYSCAFRWLSSTEFWLRLLSKPIAEYCPSFKAEIRIHNLTSKKQQQRSVQSLILNSAFEKISLWNCHGLKPFARIRSMRISTKVMVLILLSLTTIKIVLKLMYLIKYAISRIEFLPIRSARSITSSPVIIVWKISAMFCCFFRRRVLCKVFVQYNRDCSISNCRDIRTTKPSWSTHSLKSHFCYRY